MELFLPIILLGQLSPLDHRPHRAIEHDDALAQQNFQGMEVGRHTTGELSGVYAKDQETNLRIMIRRCVIGIYLFLSQSSSSLQIKTKRKRQSFAIVDLVRRWADSLRERAQLLRESCSGKVASCRLASQ